MPIEVRKPPVVAWSVAGLAAGALGGTMAAGVSLARFGDYLSPLMWMYVVLLGTLPGLLVGAGLGAVAGARAESRGSDDPTAIASAGVGALAAVAAASLIVAALTGGLVQATEVVAGAVAVALIPGALAGYVWQALALGHSPCRQRLGAIVLTVAIALVAQLAIASFADRLVSNQGPAYPGPPTSR